MWEALERWFAGNFMPHGHCYLWSPAMVWLQVLSNLTIAFAYVAISAALAVILRRIRDIPFSRMYAAFGIFIVTCGATHFLDVATIWHPIYWLDGTVRAVTAIASAGTALMLVPLVPKAVGLARAAETAHERGLRLESTYKELAEAHEKAKELERTKTEFFANVSHELRTPLALVLGPADKLLANATDPEQRRELELITRSARTLLKHVNDLLDVSRLDVGKVHARYARVDVAALVRRVVEPFEGLARERATRLDLHVPKSRIAEVDPDQVERIVANLVGNALKFTARGGVVRVALDSGTSELRLEVADDGPGVPEPLREKVFERFAQADEGSTRAHGGTGLGLAIVKDFVALHHGSVAIATAPEGGALFTVLLPERAPRGEAVEADRPRRMATTTPALALEVATARAATVDAEIRLAAELALQSAAPPESDASPRAHPLVVVAEDNAEMNAFIAETLAGDGEHAIEVLRAHDGDQALALAKRRPPDLVVTDMMMPRRSGEELLAALRADERLRDVPVLVLTARADDALRVRLLESGASDYLQKPFEAAELRARAQNLLVTKRARDLLRTELASRETDLEQLASELAARKRDLETAILTLRVARDHAEAASQQKTAFLGMVSHELRTPLTAVQLLVDRLDGEKESLPSRLQSTASRLSSAVTRLSSLVESLLQYARFQSGRLTVERQELDVKALVRGAIDDVRMQAQGKGLALVFDDEAPSLTIESDPTLLRVVVANLLMNAVKFTPSGSVTTTLTARADGVALRVTDTGPGIAAVEQARIFEPFHRVEQVRNTHVPGVGLGLSLVRDLVDNLGGTVTVSSDVGVGTTFEVILPSSVTPPRLESTT